MTAQNLPADRDAALGELWRRVQVLEAVAPAGAGGSGIQFSGASPVYGDDNVGEGLMIEATGLVAQPFSEPNAADGDEESFGIAVTSENGIIITSGLDTYFNSGYGPLRIVDSKSTGDKGSGGLSILARDVTVGGAANTNALVAEASSKSSGLTEAVIISAGNLGGSGDIYALEVDAFTSGGASGTAWAITVTGGLVALGLPTSPGPTGSLYSNLGIVTVSP